MPSHPLFHLESLGWKAFQDLCGTVLAEILGQTFEVFEPGKDIGRDGGFRGTWLAQHGEALSGTFTVQCKHTSIPDRSLSRSLLKDEVAKARKLNTDGLADVYILITNHRITGARARSLQEWLQSQTGAQCVVYGSAWLNQKIRENGRLRMLVPRLYGLGDLSQILDERAYLQAKHLLATLSDDLRKFVPTESYRKAARALEEHSFVLLLGEPAAGKTTIAATLAVSATDRWHCQTIRIDDPEEFTLHWNPDEPNQFFWIEDAFGATQYENARAQSWNRALLKLKASIRSGARIVITSRDYIYKRARDDLKQGELPLLNEAQVVVDVEGLSFAEKTAILYNHVKLGAQPPLFRGESNDS